MTRKARRRQPQHQLINEHMPPLDYGKYLAIKSDDPSFLRKEFTEIMANAMNRAKQFLSAAQANGEQFGAADPPRWAAFVHGPLNLANNLRAMLELLEVELASLDDKTRRRIERLQRLAWECGRHSVELSLYDSELVKLATSGASYAEGPKKAGKAQAERATPQHNEILLAFETWRKDNPQKRKAAFIREFKGSPHYSERQMYQILSAKL
ncbi:MAG: hypothetical protein ACK4X1_01260 [Terricaulis sp.]